MLSNDMTHALFDVETFDPNLCHREVTHDSSYTYQKILIVLFKYAL